MTAAQTGRRHVAERLLPGLERRLKAEVAGGVHFDRFTRGRYATDASHYQIMPLGVVTPRTIEEAERAIGICRAEGVPVTPRGGGSSQAGQTVNSSVIVDCSKHLNRILDLDVAGRRCPGRARHRARRSQPGAARPHGLWFPVDVSTASRATIGGMTANNSCGGRSLRYGNTRENVHLDRRAAGRRRQGAFRPGGGRPVRPAGEFAAAAAGARPVRAGRARGRRDRGALSQGAAPGRRLQYRRAGAGQERHQPRAHPGRLRGHARVLHRDRAEAVAAARPARGRRLPFRPLPRGDGGGAAHRQARARSRSNWSTRP